MASSGYGTETTVESIWTHTWDTTQFGHINVLIGTQFNFYINDDGATDMTDTAVTTMLAAETHNLFGLWDALVKESAVTDPWEFIRLWWEQNLAGNNFFERYSILIEKARKLINKEKTIEIVTRYL